MPDTQVQTPSLIESDLATHQSTHPIPISLPRLWGDSLRQSDCHATVGSSRATKKFRTARLDIDKNVTLQVAYTPKQKYMAAEILRAEYRKLGYDTSFIDKPINTDDKRRLTLLVKEGYGSRVRVRSC